jgi:formate-dependent nitrite reductase membrane component NrfD
MTTENTMTETEILRNSHLIDPSMHIWGWEIPVYLFLGGMTAGLMILAPLLAWQVKSQRSKWVRRLPFVAPVLLSAGMFALLLDLEYKLHVFRFYTTFQWTSPMSWGSWILILIYPAVLLLGLAYLERNEVDAIASRLRFLRGPINNLRAYAIQNLRKLEWANVVLGIALGTYTGILLGTLGARALWSSGLLGPLFLVSGLSTGAALLMLFPIFKDEHALVRNVDIAAIGVELVLITLLFVDLLNGSGELGRRAAALFFGGPYTATFWTLVVFGGLMVPLFMEVYESRRRIHAGLVAPVLLLVGGLALRWILVSAGQVGL